MSVPDVAATMKKNAKSLKKVMFPFNRDLPFTDLLETALDALTGRNWGRSCTTSSSSPYGYTIVQSRKGGIELRCLDRKYWLLCQIHYFNPTLLCQI